MPKAMGSQGCESGCPDRGSPGPATEPGCAEWLALPVGEEQVPVKPSSGIEVGGEFGHDSSGESHASAPCSRLWRAEGDVAPNLLANLSYLDVTAEKIHPASTQARELSHSQPAVGTQQDEGLGIEALSRQRVGSPPAEGSRGLRAGSSGKSLGCGPAPLVGCHRPAPDRRAARPGGRAPWRSRAARTGATGPERRLRRPGSVFSRRRRRGRGAHGRALLEASEGRS